MAAFLDVFEDVTKLGRKIPTDQYLLQGEFPIIDQGQKEIAGYSDDEDGLFCDVPAIIFGDHTRVLKYVNTPCFLGADGVKLLRPVDRNHNCKYLYYALCSVDIPNTGYNRHFKWLKGANIIIPTRTEQDKVVAALDKASDLLAKRRQQLAKLDELVKSRFIELFGDVESNPFQWEVVSIGEVISSSEAGWSGNGKQRPKLPGEIAVLKVSAVTKGYFIPEECKVLDDQKNIKKYVYPQKGDLLFSRANTREMVGATAIITDDYPELILPDKLWKIRFCAKTNVLYMKFVLSSKAIRSKFSAESTGTSGSMYNVSMDKFRSILIPMPPIELQIEFATFVEQTDKLKVKTQQSLAQLETLKKALMQKYFG